MHFYCQTAKKFLFENFIFYCQNKALSHKLSDILNRGFLSFPYLYLFLIFSSIFGSRINKGV